MARQLTSETIEIRRIAAEVPEDLVELRRKIWGAEKGLLQEGGLVTDNDRLGAHYLVYDRANDNKLVAATHSFPAEGSDFAVYTRLPAAVLAETVISTRSTVDPEYRGSGLLALLVYLGAREGRIQGRKWLAAYLERGMEHGRKITGVVDLDLVPPRHVSGRNGDYDVVASAMDVNYVMSNCFRRIPEALRPYLREHFFVDEIVASVMSGAKRFYAGPWFTAASATKLTRWQYFQTLAGMHMYTRWTTRLLGAVVGITPDSDLRSHYIQHLRGEIDHEVMLEADIAHLGFDVDYVRNEMVASDDIRAFMGLQESLCDGPRRDPRLFMAVPFAIEALTAFMTREFLNSLKKNIAAWGVNQPEKAMTFLAAHVHTDGGTDGHWEAARRILHTQVRTERDLQEMLSIVRVVQDTQSRAWDGYAKTRDIFSAMPIAERAGATTRDPHSKPVNRMPGHAAKAPVAGEMKT